MLLVSAGVYCIQFAAELLKKDLKYICVSYQYNEYLAWHGTFDPAFILNIVRVFFSSDVALGLPCTAALTLQVRSATYGTPTSISPNSRV